MREILFRGKTGYGEWVYGMPVANTEGVITHITYCKKEFFEELGEVLTHEVTEKTIPETVGQYTGLDDKNGVKIFEGDIMVFRTGTVGVVVHSRQGFVWQGYPQDPLNPVGYFSGKWQDDFEVIGDIHNNAELLEVE